MTELEMENNIAIALSATREGQIQGIVLALKYTGTTDKSILSSKVREVLISAGWKEASIEMWLEHFGTLE